MGGPGAQGRSGRAGRRTSNEPRDTAVFDALSVPPIATRAAVHERSDRRHEWSHCPGLGFTVTVARAGIDVPSTVPVTVKVPGSAYSDGSTCSQLTLVLTLSTEPSLNVACTVSGRAGATPASVTTSSGSMNVIETASVVRTYTVAFAVRFVPSTRPRIVNLVPPSATCSSVTGSQATAARVTEPSP